MFVDDNLYTVEQRWIVCALLVKTPVALNPRILRLHNYSPPPGLIPPVAFFTRVTE